MESFLRRHSFALRTSTTTCQKRPKDFKKALVKYSIGLNDEGNYKNIFACDQTAVQLDFSSSKCIDAVGSKEVAVLTTGHEKLSITIMLTARSVGKKQKPFVLMQRSRIDKKIELEKRRMVQ